MPTAPYVAVLPQGHRLARKTRLRPKDFEGENFVSLGHSSLSRFRIDRVFTEHGVNRILRIEAPLSEIACALVASGVGVALCEPFTAHEYATRGIVVRPFEPQHRLRVRRALSRPAQRTSLLAREFIDSFRAHVADFPAPPGVARRIMMPRPA